MKLKKARLSYVHEDQEIKVFDGPEVEIMNEEMDSIKILSSDSIECIDVIGAKVIFSIDRILIYGNYIKLGQETYTAAKISCFP